MKAIFADMWKKAYCGFESFFYSFFMKDIELLIQAIEARSNERTSKSHLLFE